MSEKYQELPVFTSHYSIGRSILTLEEAGQSQDDGADSIFDLCVQNDIKNCFIAENNPSGFVAAIKNGKKSKVNVRLGLKLPICSDVNAPDEIKSTEHKITIWEKNDQGYHDLIKLYSEAAVFGKVTYPRLDYNMLKKMWSTNLLLTIPFYDSFLHKNTMYGGRCLPDLDFCNPTLEIQNNTLPFNFLIKGAVQKWANAKKWPTLNTRNILYKSRDDFENYLAFRCLHNGSTLNKPELEHMSSDSFCFESLV